jgi:hypothetical protein
MDFLLDTIYSEIVCYFRLILLFHVVLFFFSGHGTQCDDYTGKEEDGLMELYCFYDESKKKEKKLPKIVKPKRGNFILFFVFFFLIS